MINREVAIALIKRPTIEVIEVRGRQKEEVESEEEQGRTKRRKQEGWDEKF